MLCTAGEGWYQEAGKPAVSLTPGSVVMIPAEVKHWHGAKKDSWFSHIAVEVPGEGCPERMVRASDGRGIQQAVRRIRYGSQADRGAGPVRHVRP